jgi:two-component system chemotaxis response regulator CheB
MDKIRVLVVDDSLVVRRALRDLFREDPEIDVVGVAESGTRALEQLAALQPDLVTLDVEMPDMDGLQALRLIRSQGSRIPIIMFSKHTTSGAQVTLDALELGASDVVAKPSANGADGADLSQVRRHLATRIRALGRRAKRLGEAGAKPVPSQGAGVQSGQRDQPLTAVGIAVSTGGPSALLSIVEALSPELHVPIFITQHIPPLFTAFLAERLRARGTLPVCEAHQGQIVQPGTIYIAPGDNHLNVAHSEEGVVVTLSQEPPENSCRPSADVMFRSLATLYGPGLLGIVMTGMGQDGRRGCETIKDRGGTVVAQDEASSLVWGMPRAVVMAGLHDHLVPLSEIAPLINATCLRTGVQTS